jgi:ferric-dicitrate binding protein FerR (iron transport regulator)
VSAIAASLAMLMAGYGAWQVPVWQADYHTSVGQRQSLTLADGSRVTLNSGSAVSVAFSADQRKVVLEAGEACSRRSMIPARSWWRPVASRSAAVRRCSACAASPATAWSWPRAKPEVGGQVLQPRRMPALRPPGSAAS